MMDIKELEKLAYLARIKISEKELSLLQKDMEEILEYVSQIKHVSEDVGASETLLLRNVIREDINPHETEIYSEEIMRAVPQQEKGFVKVKKILN